MKYPNTLTRFAGLLTIALLAANARPALAQKSFASPDDAVKALQAASESKDKGALDEIFGPNFHELLTGDAVQDANNAQKFAAALAESCKPVNDGDGKVTLEIGTNSWPMPIPLVKAGEQWHFDTAAGKEEIINRHIGKDELCAIGICRAYVTAQRQFADANPKVGGGPAYALKFKSAAGQKDGLYWESAAGETASPFGPLVAEAHAQGYGTKIGTGAKPFHGYFFRILTSQGSAATGGKMDYLSAGVMSGGFALVAYPEKWGQSGIMTFIVNQEGKVYQRDFGTDTADRAEKMTEYNPTTKWTLVKDDGIPTAVTEK